MKTKDKGITIAILVVGLIIRLIYIIKYPVPVRDSFRYLGLIEEWNLSGKIPLDDKYPPLGLFFLRIPSIYFDCDAIKGGILVNMVLGLLIIYLCIRISKAITKSSCFSFAAGILAATHPTLVEYSCQMLRENSYLAFCCLTVLTMISYVSCFGIVKLVLSGCFSSLAHLCRHESLELMFAVLVVVLLSGIRKPYKKQVIYLFIFFVSCLLTYVIVSYAIDIPIDYYRIFLEKLLSKNTVHSM